MSLLQPHAASPQKGEAIIAQVGGAADNFGPGLFFALRARGISGARCGITLASVEPEDVNSHGVEEPLTVIGNGCIAHEAKEIILGAIEEPIFE